MTTDPDYNEDIARSVRWCIEAHLFGEATLILNRSVVPDDLYEQLLAEVFAAQAESNKSHKV